MLKLMIYCSVPVTDDMVEQFLEGQTLNETIQQRRLFVVDFTDLEDVPHQAGCEVGASYFVNPFLSNKYYKEKESFEGF